MGATVPIIILVLNNDGYMVERALEPYPDWSYNDLAKWRYADLPRRWDALTGYQQR